MRNRKTHKMKSTRALSTNKFDLSRFIPHLVLVQKLVIDSKQLFITAINTISAVKPPSKFFALMLLAGNPATPPASMLITAAVFALLLILTFTFAYLK